MACCKITLYSIYCDGFLIRYKTRPNIPNLWVRWCLNFKAIPGHVGVVGYVLAVCWIYSNIGMEYSPVVNHVPRETKDIQGFSIPMCLCVPLIFVPCLVFLGPTMMGRISMGWVGCSIPTHYGFPKVGKTSG